MLLYNPTVSGSLTVTGSLTTTGTLTAQTLVVQTVTSSVSYLTGSTQHGSVSSNTHQFTGSVYFSGSVGYGTNSPSYRLSLVSTPANAGFDGINVTTGTADVLGLYRTGATYSYGMVGANQSWIYSNYGDLNIVADAASANIKFGTAGGTSRLVITSAGLLQYKAITDNGLVGSDASGNLNRVNPTYTEIATGTITYSETFGYGWGINNSFPGNIRNYTQDLIAGTSSAAYNSNIYRGVTFDLGSAKAVRKIIEIGYSTKNLDTIQVQYSTDNSNWTSIFTYSHILGRADKIMEFNHTGAVSARYWRWFISGWVQRAEENYYTYESVIYI